MKSIKLSNPIRRNGSDTNFEDVVNIKKVLRQIGYYETPTYGITEFPDERMYSALERFQREKNLKIDGVVIPGGETEDALNKELKVSAKSPIIRCTVCGGPHGGSKGDLCPSCDAKM